MSKQNVVITVKSDELVGGLENPNWTVTPLTPDEVMLVGDYDVVELTICDTEGE